MAILEKEVWVGLGSSNIKYYEDLGYEILKRKNQKGELRVPRGTEILVKIKDLPKRSHIELTKICDECGDHVPNQPYYAILISREMFDGKDRCFKCGSIMKGNLKKINVKYENTFEYMAKKESKEYLLNEFSQKNKRKPFEIAYKSNDKFLWNCSTCESEYDMSLNDRTSNKNCPFCAGHRVNETNCLSTVKPEIIKFLVEPEDGKKYTCGSGQKIKFICPECGLIQNKMIWEVVNKGFSCSRCSDGISYPEKFMISVLNQLNTQYEMQKVFNWSKKIYHLKPKFNRLSGLKRYDFYIPDKKCIIEVHGNQHYSTSFDYLGGRNIEEEIENDDLKMYLAFNNGIKNYIILDCRNSELDWIKKNILNSNLAKLFDLSNIDWSSCHEFACNTLVRKACDLWNQGMRSTLEIGNILKISGGTTLKYLKQGEKLDWIKYDKNEVMIYKSKKIASSLSIKIVQLTKNNEFIKEWNSAKEAETKLGIFRSNINHVLKGKLKSAGGFKWMYKEDYESRLSNTK